MVVIRPMTSQHAKILSVDKDSLQMIYVSFIRAKIEYSSFIWDNCQTYEKEDFDLVSDPGVQMSIVRTITGALRKGTGHDLISNELNWPSLADRRKGVESKNFIKIINKESPVSAGTDSQQRIRDVRPHSRYPAIPP